MKKRVKLLQTGDLHIGAMRSKWGHKRALERGKQLFETIYRVAKENECDGIMVAGDIFDNKTVTLEERSLVTLMLTSLSKDIPWYVTGGNHDLLKDNRSNLSYLSEVTEKTSRLKNLHVGFADREAIWEITQDPSPLKVLGVSSPLSESQAWVEKRVKELPEDEDFVFVGHGSIYGCTRNDFGWKPDGEEDHGLNLSEASKAKNVIYWAYGDIHKRQKLPTVERGNGYYAGSPIQMNFGEEENRGVLIIALDHNGERWDFKGKKYVRIDHEFDPLVNVESLEDLEDVPESALLKLKKGLKIPSEMHAQVVATKRVVEDSSTPASVMELSGKAEDTVLEDFDPLVSSLDEGVLSGLDSSLRKEAKEIIAEATDRYRQRVFVQ